MRPIVAVRGGPHARKHAYIGDGCVAKNMPNVCQDAFRSKWDVIGARNVHLDGSLREPMFVAATNMLYASSRLRVRIPTDLIYAPRHAGRKIAHRGKT